MLNLVNKNYLVGIRRARIRAKYINLRRYTRCDPGGEEDGTLCDQLVRANEKNFYGSKNDKLNAMLMDLERECLNPELEDEDVTELEDNDEYIDFPFDMDNFYNFFRQVEPEESDLMALSEFDVDLGFDKVDEMENFNRYSDVRHGDIFVEADRESRRVDEGERKMVGSTREKDKKIDLINCDITEPHFRVSEDHMEQFPTLEVEYKEIEKNPPVYRSYRKMILGELYKDEGNEEVEDEVKKMTWDDPSQNAFDSAFIDSYHVYDVFDSISSEYSDLLRGTLDIFDSIVMEKQKQLMSRARRKRRYDIWWAKTWKMREEGQRLARETRLKRDAAKAEIERMRMNDPNWIYYPGCQVWVSRELLRNDMVRNAIGAINNNPSLKPKAKRYMINGIQEDVRRIVIMEDVPERHKVIARHLVESETRVPPDDPKEIDGLLKLPYSDWREMMSEIEASMDPILKSQKYSILSSKGTSNTST